MTEAVVAVVEVVPKAAVVAVVVVAITCACFSAVCSGGLAICFFEWIHSRLQPMLKGIAKGSVVTCARNEV